MPVPDISKETKNLNQLLTFDWSSFETSNESLDEWSKV